MNERSRQIATIVDQLVGVLSDSSKREIENALALSSSAARDFSLQASTRTVYDDLSSVLRKQVKRF